MHFKEILKQYASTSNLMEVVDVCIATTPYMQEIELFKLQEIQKKQIQIKMDICSLNLDEDQISSKREKLYKLQETYVKLKNKYVQMSVQKIYDFEDPDQKLPAPTAVARKREKRRRILYAFVTFKHCETKDSALSFFQ